MAGCGFFEFNKGEGPVKYAYCNDITQFAGFNNPSAAYGPNSKNIDQLYRNFCIGTQSDGSPNPKGKEEWAYKTTESWQFFLISDAQYSINFWAKPVQLKKWLKNEHDTYAPVPWSEEYARLKAGKPTLEQLEGAKKRMLEARLLRKADKSQPSYTCTAGSISTAFPSVYFPKAAAKKAAAEPAAPAAPAAPPAKKARPSSGGADLLAPVKPKARKSPGPGKAPPADKGPAKAPPADKGPAKVHDAFLVRAAASAPASSNVKTVYEGEAYDHYVDIFDEGVSIFTKRYSHQRLFFAIPVGDHVMATALTDADAVPFEEFAISIKDDSPSLDDQNGQANILKPEYTFVEQYFRSKHGIQTMRMIHNLECEQTSTVGVPDNFVQYIIPAGIIDLRINYSLASLLENSKSEHSAWLQAVWTRFQCQQELNKYIDDIVEKENLAAITKFKDEFLNATTVSQMEDRHEWFKDLLADEAMTDAEYQVMLGDQRKKIMEMSGYNPKKHTMMKHQNLDELLMFFNKYEGIFSDQARLDYMAERDRLLDIVKDLTDPEKSMQFEKDNGPILDYFKAQGMPGLALCYEKNYQVFAAASRLIKKQKAKAKAEKAKAQEDRAKLEKSQLEIQELRKRLEAIEQLQQANAKSSSNGSPPASRKRARKSGALSVSFSMGASPIAGASLAGSPRGSRAGSPKPARSAQASCRASPDPDNIMEGKRARTQTNRFRAHRHS
jgi:hypothetical protein